MEEAPKFEMRAELRYIGTRVIMSMSQFGDAIPALRAQLVQWCDAHSVEPAGNALLRYHIIDMPDRMDVEVGVPVNAAPRTDGAVSAGVLSAGRYATLTFTGVANGVACNRRLIEWIGEQGQKADSHETESGEAFAGRFETLLTDPNSEPDQSKWKTEVAIKIRED